MTHLQNAKHVDPEKLRPYIGKWVALDGDPECIVGSGINAVECAATAKAKGHPDAVLLFVPRLPLVTTPFSATQA